MSEDDGPIPVADELSAPMKETDEWRALELEAVRARIVDDEDVEEYAMSVLHGYEDLEAFASNLGAVVGIWARIDEIERRHGLIFGAYYFYDFENVEYCFAHPLEPSQLGYRWIRPGAKILAKTVNLFSSDWYLCHAFLHLLKCVDATGDEQLRESFLFGKALAEGSWKARSEEGYEAASREKLRSGKAGVGGAKFQRERKSANLEAVLVEIEALSHLVGEMSEERIVSQAFDNVIEANPSFPKSQKTRESYATELRSKDPFKARYWAVFAKKA